MNDRRFIELLNLYVDEQIGPDEAAELEAEVLRNPERRRTYNDYCRLQRGCCLLGDGARTLAPSAQGFARSLREAERKIAAPRRSYWRASYSGIFSATAVAACVAIIFVAERKDPSESVGGNARNQNPVAGVTSLNSGAEPLHVVTTTSPDSTPRAFEFQPVLAAAALDVARTAKEAEIASSDREALEWMQRIELLPLTRVAVDEQAFETRPILHQENRVFRSRHSIPGNAEFTAFQFQR